MGSVTTDSRLRGPGTPTGRAHRGEGQEAYGRPLRLVGGRGGNPGGRAEGH